MTNMLHPLLIQRGIVHYQGHPALLVTADYPYYRDDAGNWEHRLSLLKAMSLKVISSYIPWRHHQTNSAVPPDFTGHTQANRNVHGFLALCQSLGLSVIAKPGPFIHAETNYGGLPDWTCPLNNPNIEQLKDIHGNGCYWAGGRVDSSGQAAENWPLPAPFSPEYLYLSREWLARVSDQVILPYQAPAGPIVAIQVGNEGIYSNGQHAPWAYDFSPSALALYRQFLQGEYLDLSRYNTLNGTEFDAWDDIQPPTTVNNPHSVRSMRSLVDWGKFQAWYMDRIFNEWYRPLKTTLPMIVNQNPPLDAPFGLDAWLTRVEPEAWGGFHYGFTNWVGDVSAKPSAFDRYLLTAKRYPGVNMEENWGFAELYDPAYIDAATSFYQTLVILNGGATGFNIYTGVGTGFTDTNMEVIPKAPYPDAAPITAEGIWTPKAEIARWIVKFFDIHGEDFLACKPIQGAAWGFYTPFARVAAWSQADDPLAPLHGKHLGDFQSQMRRLHLDYSLLNLETATLSDMLGCGTLVVTGGIFLPAFIQNKLAAYTQQGGRLFWIGDLPYLDENFLPCNRLVETENSLIRLPNLGELENYLHNHLVEVTGSADVWIRSHPEKDLHFVTVLIPAQGNPQVKVTLHLGELTHQLDLSATPSGGAIFRVINGKVSDFIIKGHNGFLRHSVPPRCVFDQQILGDERPGDYACLDATAAFLPAENK